jgi:hypothetical protein
MNTYPATFDIERPEKFARSQLALRLALVVVLSAVGVLSGLQTVLWIGVPVLAAILISQKGAARYHDEANASMTSWLRFIIGAYAYLVLLTDKLPGDAAAGPNSQFEVTPTGTPTVGGTLARIILAIPHAIVLMALGLVAGLLIVFAAVMILVRQSYPAPVYNFLRGYVRWHARVLAYLSALVDEYPPFSLSNGGGAAPAPAAVAGAS